MDVTNVQYIEFIKQVEAHSMFIRNVIQKD